MQIQQKRKKRIIVMIMIIGIMIAISIFFLYQKGSFTGSAVSNQDLATESETSNRYHGIWPSQERFDEYLESDREKFRGPYISVWDPEQQKEIYGTAWGMNASDMPEPVGNMPMQEGKPYFISPDAEFNVTWVGKLPEHVTFELKHVPETYSENYIVLPLNTVIRTAKDLCEAKADDGSDLMTDDDSIMKWDVKEQKLYTPATEDWLLLTCREIKRRPDKYSFDLYPGEVLLITVSEDKNWTQK